MPSFYVREYESRTTSFCPKSNSKATKVFDTQQKAIEKGREIAINQQSELLIHNQKGQIRERNSYGNDPRSSKG